MLTNKQFFIIIVLGGIMYMLMNNKNIKVESEPFAETDAPNSNEMIAPAPTTDVIVSNISDISNAPNASDNVIAPAPNVPNSLEQQSIQSNLVNNDKLKSVLDNISVNGYIYYGCYKDKRAPNRFLPTRINADEKITIDDCSNLAKLSNEKIFGFQNESNNKGECWVGNNKSFEDLNKTFEKLNDKSYLPSKSCRISTDKNIPVGRSWSNSIYMNIN